MATTTLNIKIECAHLAQMIDDAAALLRVASGETAEEHRDLIMEMIDSGDIYRAVRCGNGGIRLDPSDAFLAVLDELRSSGAE